MKTLHVRATFGEHEPKRLECWCSLYSYKFKWWQLTADLTNGRVAAHSPDKCEVFMEPPEDWVLQRERLFADEGEGK